MRVKKVEKKKCHRKKGKMWENKNRIGKNEVEKK